MEQLGHYKMKGKFLVTEWDGTWEVIEIAGVTADSVTIRYCRDGLQHEVTPQHLLADLQARPIARV